MVPLLHDGSKKANFANHICVKLVVLEFFAVFVFSVPDLMLQSPPISLKGIINPAITSKSFIWKQAILFGWKATKYGLIWYLLEPFPKPFEIFFWSIRTREWCLYAYKALTDLDDNLKDLHEILMLFLVLITNLA